MPVEKLSQMGIGAQKQYVLPFVGQALRTVHGDKRLSCSSTTLNGKPFHQRHVAEHVFLFF